VITFSGTTQVYDGNPLYVGVTTSPNVTVSVVYPGGIYPTNPGTYSVTATVTQIGFSGTASTTFTITNPSWIIERDGYPIGVPYYFIDISNYENYGSVLSLNNSSEMLVKYGDDIFIFVKFLKSTVINNPPVISTAKISFKKFNQNEIQFTTDELFSKSVGFDKIIYGFLFHGKIQGESLQKMFGKYSSGLVDYVSLSGEVEWSEINQFGIGPEQITTKSDSFSVRVTRPLNMSDSFNFL
jgi:hypothetical protein